MKGTYDKTTVQSFIHELLGEHRDFAEDPDKGWLTDEHVLGMLMDLINTCMYLNFFHFDTLLKILLGLIDCHKHCILIVAKLKSNLD